MALSLLNRADLGLGPVPGRQCPCNAPDTYALSNKAKSQCKGERYAAIALLVAAMVLAILASCAVDPSVANSLVRTARWTGVLGVCAVVSSMYLAHKANYLRDREFLYSHIHAVPHAVPRVQV